MFLRQALPDVSKKKLSFLKHKIDRVGLSGLEIPVSVCIEGKNYLIHSSVDSMISLDRKDEKGIHMSRLYESLEHLKEGLDPNSLKLALKKIVQSQKDLTENSYLKISFKLPLSQKSLKSNKKLIKYYPLSLYLSYEKGKIRLFQKTRIYYSSTCPCSLALSQRAVREKFEKDFMNEDKISKKRLALWLEEKSNVFTPHAQRSYLDLSWVLNEFPEDLFSSFKDLVKLIEDKLETAVQIFAKRVDEKNFAEKNAKNPMFCEDAIRRVKDVLEKNEEIFDYKIKVCHMESLHPYDAVSSLVKGVKGGFEV